MSYQRTRREVLRDVGRGMFLATLGPAVAFDLGLAPAYADDGTDRLTFGALDPLVNFIHETPPDKILAKTIEKLNAGLDLKTLVAAAALANTRAFGGEDYVGFHTLMALAPAYHMSTEETDAAKKPLAVLKVLYRNATRLSEMGQTKAEVLKPVKPSIDDNGLAKTNLRDLVRQNNADTAERAFARQCRDGTPQADLDYLMEMVDDATEVHRVVLASRAWDLLDFVGKEQTHTMLRQSVRYCLKSEKNGSQAKFAAEIRALLPKLVEQHHFDSKPLGHREVDDAWVTKFAETIFKASPTQAAEAAAAALAEGIVPSAIGQAVAVAANELTLRDNGRRQGETAPNKGLGSCHGDSIGVHACDSAHAWRTIAQAGGHRTTATSLTLAAYQVALDRGHRGGDFFTWQPYPRPEHVEKAKDLPADKLLSELGGAVRENDQGRAAAIAARLGDTHAAEAFALLREFAVSEDGALHAEKYYRTTTAEAAEARNGHKTRQLVALARVSASAYGQPAPGVKEAKQLLKV
jgi:hypothetical protein